MMQISYSIIIPHKNIPDLLERCLNSIPKRDDVQVIVVDDNSDEYARHRLKCLEEQYEHVDFVYTCEGRGAGYARNVGLKRAEGKWVLFSDADDYYTGSFSDVLDKYRDVTADLVCFPYNCIDSVSFERIPSDYFLRLLELSKTNKSYLYNIPAMYSKLVNYSLIKEYGLQFEEVRFCNDNWFNLQVVYHSDSYVIGDETIYNYLVRSGSLTTSPRTREDVRIRLDVLRNAVLFLNDKAPEGRQFWLNEYWADLHTCKRMKDRFFLLFDSQKKSGWKFTLVLFNKYLFPKAIHSVLHNRFTKSLKVR